MNNILNNQSLKIVKYDVKNGSYLSSKVLEHNISGNQKWTLSISILLKRMIKTYQRVAFADSPKYILMWENIL